jgi:hypothetical protein
VLRRQGEPVPVGAARDVRRDAGRLRPHRRLAQEGSLAITDPAEAAEHLFAPTFGQVSNRSMFMADQLSDTEVDQIVTSGVAVFLRAYRPV